MVRKIIALFSALVITFSITASAYAAERSSLGDGIANFWNGFMTLTSPAYAALRGLISEFLPGDKTSETATEEDWKNAYDAYVNSIRGKYGTTNIESLGTSRVVLRWEYSSLVPSHVYKVLTASESVPYVSYQSIVDGTTTSAYAYSAKAYWIVPSSHKTAIGL